MRGSIYRESTSNRQTPETIARICALHPSIRGLNPSMTSLTYIGEAGPSHAMGLTVTGANSYAGQLQAKSLLGAMFLCPFENAQIRITKVGGKDDRASFQSAAEQYQLDNRALQAALAGLLGKARSGISMVEQSLASTQRTYDAGNPGSAQRADDLR